jgi:SAM-dependent methyltransferase
MTERALIFGSVAHDYERHRPDYPDEIADEVLAYAGHPLHTALEIGAGTGKATRFFAAHGLQITATEPDAAMLGELRKHVPGGVRCVQAAFEVLPLDAAYDLVYAAAALHWTDPVARWARIAAMLRPDGVFACFGSPMRIADPETRRAFDAARSRYLADDEVPAPDGTPPDSAMRWPGAELQGSALFTDVRQVTIRRRVTTPAADWVAHLATLSAYLQLGEAVRRDAMAAIREALPEQVLVDADVTLHLARRT